MILPSTGLKTEHPLWSGDELFTSAGSMGRNVMAKAAVGRRKDKSV